MVGKCPCTGACVGRGQFVVSIGCTCGSRLPMCSSAAFPSCTPPGVSWSQTLMSSSVSLGIPLYFVLQRTEEEKCLICYPRAGILHSYLHLFPPHTGILGSYPCSLQSQSPSFSAPSKGLGACVCSSHIFSFCLEGESLRSSAAGRAELCWGYCYAGRCSQLLRQDFDEKIITGQTDGCWMPSPNVRASCVPFSPGSEGTGYGCALKTFPKILELVVCDVQKLSTLYLNKVIPSS